MKNLFNDISQDERNRILEMHKSATRKNYLSEQTPAPAPAPAAAPAKVPAQAPVPTGPTGGVTKKPAVVPGGDKPQGPAPIYTQIDVATFNPKFQMCWNENTASGKKYISLKQKAMNGGDEEEQLMVYNNNYIRQSMFNTINQVYLNNLTKPMNSDELGRLWNTVKTYPITYSFTDPKVRPREVKSISSTVGEAIKSVYTNENEMKIDYLNTFNCAMKGIQGAQPTQGAQATQGT
jgi:hypothetical protein